MGLTDGMMGGMGLTEGMMGGMGLTEEVWMIEKTCGMITGQFNII